MRPSRRRAVIWVAVGLAVGVALGCAAIVYWQPTRKRATIERHMIAGGSWCIRVQFPTTPAYTRCDLVAQCYERVETPTGDARYEWRHDTVVFGFGFDRADKGALAWMNLCAMPVQEETAVPGSRRFRIWFACDWYGSPPHPPSKVSAVAPMFLEAGTQVLTCPMFVELPSQAEWDNGELSLGRYTLHRLDAPSLEYRILLRARK